MHRSTTFTAFSLFLVNSVALNVPRATQPANWPKSLEPWQIYNTRYLAMGCELEHDTSFFHQCCHPLEANQTVADLPAQCKDNGDDNKQCSEDIATNAPTNDLVMGGFATFFYQKGIAGACGVVHTDQDLVAAMDKDRYNPTLCGKQVSITNSANQKNVIVTIADDCPTCINANCIDLSVAAFDKISDPKAGIVPITWNMVENA